MNNNALQKDCYLLGRILLKLEKEQEALFYLKKSHQLKEEHKSEFLDRTYRSVFMESLATTNEELISLLEKLSKKDNNKNYEQQAFYYSEGGKAMALLDMLGEATQGIRSKIPKAVSEEINLLHAKINALQTLFSSANETEEKEGILEKIVRAQENLRALELKSRELYPKYASIMTPAPKNIEYVQRSILKDNETALLEYYTGVENSFVFVVTKNDFNLISLKKSDSEFLKDIKKLRAPFEGIKSGSFLLGELKKSDINLFSKLYSELVECTIPFLKGVNKIIIIPHGSLNYISFEMLAPRIEHKGYNENVLLSEYAKPHYLVEDYSITYAPSISILDPEFFRKEKETIKSGDILVFANPAFGQVPSNETDKTESEGFLTRSIRESIESLPHSEMEAEMITRSFKNPLIYEKQNASEEIFIKQSPYYPMIHLSTHAFINQNLPIYSSLVFAYNDEIKDVDLLHAYEIFSLDLNCELITLSACETGIGEDAERLGGEGVTGLSRAFLYAGAKSLVVSLWQVSDESTSILMAEFYKNLKEKGMSKVEALRQAKLSLMKMEKKIGNRSLSYSHPFFWAPFILIGEPD